MTFSYLQRGCGSAPYVTRNITIYELIGLITNNPNASIIQQLHLMERGSLQYNEAKKKLPCIKPHGTFDKYCEEKSFNTFSGYIFFDIDVCDAELIKQWIISEYADKVCMVGKSVSGKGIFFYVRIGNPDVINIDNFIEVQHYLINTIFKNLKIDLNSLGITRNHIFPYDKELYFNPEISVTIPEGEINKKTITSRINTLPPYCINTTYEGFEDIQECNKHIIWNTPFDIGNEEYVIGDFENAKLFVPKIIKDGTKHKTFRMMVNQILFNNPDIEFKYVVSFINYLNANYTGGAPMKTKEMVFVVNSEYKRIKETGEIFGTKYKHVLTNPNLPKQVRQRIGAKGFGEYRKQKSIDKIIQAINDLKEQDVKPTIKAVAAILNGTLSKATIERHWRTIVPKASMQEQIQVKPDEPLKQPKCEDIDVRMVPLEIVQYAPKENVIMIRSVEKSLQICKQWFIDNFFSLKDDIRHELSEYLLDDSCFQFIKEVKEICGLNMNHLFENNIQAA